MYENKRFIFWGTGSLSKRTYTDVLMSGIHLEMDFFIDNDITRVGMKIFEKNTVHADDIKKIKTEQHLIVVCSSYEQEIIKQLIDLGYVESVDFILSHNFIGYLEYCKAVEQIERYNELKVIVGAADTSQRGWIATNQSCLDLLVKEDWNRLFGTRKIKTIVAEHVWEHLTYTDGVIAASHCYEQLEQGGRLRIAVPDGNHSNPYYIQCVKPNGYGSGSDDHKELYTYLTLERMISDAGFKKIEKIEYFDEKGHFFISNWSSEDGHIQRSKINDARNWRGDNVYTSLIVDAIK